MLARWRRRFKHLMICRIPWRDARRVVVLVASIESSGSVGASRTGSGWNHEYPAEIYAPPRKPEEERNR